MEPTFSQLLANNRRLAPAFERMAAFATTEPQALEPLDLATHGEVPEWFRGYPNALQPWPCLVGGEKLQELERVLPALSRLFRSVPKRLFGNDAARLGDYFGLEERLVRFMLEEPSGLDTAVARGDFIETADGLRCIELNLSAHLGGWQIQLLLGLWNQAPWMRSFLAETGIEVRYRDPIAGLFQHVVNASRKVAPLSGECNVFLVIPPIQEEIRWIQEGMLVHFIQHFERYMAGRPDGLRGALVTGNPEDLEVRPEGVFAGGRRMHALVEYGQDLHRTDIYTAFRLGTVKIFNGPAYELVNDKRSMALLSRWATSDLFDAEERRLIESYIPWTREVGENYVEYQGEREYLPELLEDHREGLVIKKGSSYGGEAVVIGPRTEPDRWEDLCEQALEEGDWIVQEWSEPLPLAFVHDGIPRAHDVIWGHFAFGDSYGGTFLRMMPQGGEGIINSARGATVGMLMEVVNDPQDLERSIAETVEMDEPAILV